MFQKSRKATVKTDLSYFWAHQITAKKRKKIRPAIFRANVTTPNDRVNYINQRWLATSNLIKIPKNFNFSIDFFLRNFPPELCWKRSESYQKVTYAYVNEPLTCLPKAYYYYNRWWSCPNVAKRSFYWCWTATIDIFFSEQKLAENYFFAARNIVSRR